MAYVWLVFLPRSSDSEDPPVIRVFEKEPTKEVLEKEWADMLKALDLQNDPQASFEYAYPLEKRMNFLEEYAHQNYAYLWLQIERHELR